MAENSNIEWTRHTPDRAADRPYLASLPVLQPGDLVNVDGEQEARVIHQTPLRMFTIVQNCGMKWTVMTERLTKLPNETPATPHP